MKIQNIFRILHACTIFIFIMLISGTTSQAQVTKDNKLSVSRKRVKIKQFPKRNVNKLHFTLIQDESLSINAASININEHGVLQGFSSVAFEYVNNSQRVIPIINEPVVSARKFLNYINSDGQNFSGFRIYAGLTSDFKLIPIICLANNNEPNKETESEYKLFNEREYLLNLPESKQKHEAWKDYSRYKDSVMVFGESMLTNVKAMSRYYSSSQMTRYINENTDTNSPSFDSCKVMIEIGYVPEILSEEFYNRDRDLRNKEVTNSQIAFSYLPTPEQHVGFTIMFHMIDSRGNPVILTDDPDPPSSYRGMYLEVGSPCPPTCGELYKVGSKEKK